jgi:hypothetical protein
MLFPIVMLLVAVGMVIAVAVQSKVRSNPTREERMVAMDLSPASSYEQTTNHLPATPVDMGPIAGTETPFRVNAYNAYM